MKQKDISILGFVYINAIHPEEDNDVVLHEMAFDEENIKKLVESPVYKSASYYNALRYTH